MNSLLILIKRNIKIFFKDKGTFFSALISPLIILVLYATFLAGVYYDSFSSSVPKEIYETIPLKLVNGFVNGWLISCLIANCTITISFIANLCMVKDRVTGVNADLNMTPVKKGTKFLAYYISTAIITFLISIVMLIVGFGYIAINGWYISFSDILLILMDVILLVLFGTCLSSIVSYFLYSQGAISAVATLVSSIYGFICGAYLPISQFSSAIQTTIKILPGTYGTSLLHRHFMQGSIKKLGKYFPQDVLNGIIENFDINLSVFNHNISELMMFLILILTNIVLIIIFILINRFVKEKE